MQQDVAQTRSTLQPRSLDIEAFTATPTLPTCGEIGKVCLVNKRNAHFHYLLWSADPDENSNLHHDHTLHYVSTGPFYRLTTMTYLAGRADQRCRGSVLIFKSTEDSYFCAAAEDAIAHGQHEPNSTFKMGVQRTNPTSWGRLSQSS